MSYDPISTLEQAEAAVAAGEAHCAAVRRAIAEARTVAEIPTLSAELRQDATTRAFRLAEPLRQLGADPATATRQVRADDPAAAGHSGGRGFAR